MRHNPHAIPPDRCTGMTRADHKAAVVGGREHVEETTGGTEMADAGGRDLVGQAVLPAVRNTRSVDLFEAHRLGGSPLSPAVANGG